jgi:hypothetical protein
VQLSIASASQALNLPPVGKPKENMAGDSRLSTLLAQARVALAEMRDLIFHFCTESTRLLRYHSLGGELRDVIRTLVSKDELATLKPEDFQNFTKAVCRELQCKQERIWFNDFQTFMESSGYLPREAVQKLRDRWLSTWNTRRVVEQSTCFMVAGRTKELLRKAAGSFPIASLVSDTDMSFFFSEITDAQRNAVASEHSQSRFEEVFTRQRLRSAQQQQLQQLQCSKMSRETIERQSSAQVGRRPMSRGELVGGRLRPRKLMHRTLQQVIEPM